MYEILRSGIDREESAIEIALQMPPVGPKEQEQVYSGPLALSSLLIA